MDNNGTTNDGGIFLETRVFPVLESIGGSGNTPNTVEYKGTCFLVNLAQRHVFVTARHLLDRPPDTYDLYIAYNTPDQHPSYLKVRAGYVNHLDHDISFFIPTVQMTEEYEGLLSPMQVLRYPLPVGQGILVYGFPQSGQTGLIKEKPLVKVKRNRYEGKVLGIEHDYPFKPSTPTVYHLDIPAPPGLSGAPVMVVHNADLAVAGYIIGEQTTNGIPFAVASDTAPLIGIEELLINVPRQL